MKKYILLGLLITVAAFGCNKSQAPTRDQNISDSDNQSQNGQDQTHYKVAVIALDDGGKLGAKIGCNDSVVFLQRASAFTTQPLNAALKDLFSLGSAKINDPAFNQELYNVIYNMQQKPDTAQNLKFDHATIDNGIAKVYLTGSFAGLGGVCDSPRVQAQIDNTALQFSSVKSVETYLNNTKVDWQQFNSMK